MSVVYHIWYVDKLWQTFFMHKKSWNIFEQWKTYLLKKIWPLLTTKSPGVPGIWSISEGQKSKSTFGVC